MASLTIYRDSIEVATVEIDEKTVLTRKLMNEDKVVSDFVSQGVLPLELGDYILVNLKKYYLNQLPNIEKVNERTFKYSVVFQSELYDLYNKLFRSVEGLSDWSYTGNAADFLAKIVESMNEISTGWAAGEVDPSGDKNMDFINENCRTALTKIASAFNYEFEVNNKVIDFKNAIGKITPHIFKYGKNNGLYSIERRAFESQNVFTRVFGYGSERNIPYTYRNRAKRLVFEERYLEKNVSVFGIKEGHYTNEDIYPHRTGTISDVSNVFRAGVYDANSSYIKDDALNFVIDYGLNPKPKIVFKSGDLSGLEFTCFKGGSADANGIQQAIYFNAITESDGLAFPNENSKPKVGDTYTIVDIPMPAIYIHNAEAELKAATQVYLDENCVPKSLYLVKIDSKYAKANSIVLDAGDLVRINDTQLGVDRAIRIAEVSFPLVNPNQITATIADFIPYTLVQLVSKNAVTSAKAIQSAVNKISNVTKTSISTTTNVTNVFNEEPEPGFILVNNRKFRHVKGFDNVTYGTLEAGDWILDNYFDRITYVRKWQYLGGLDSLKENWEQIETVER